MLRFCVLLIRQKKQDDELMTGFDFNKTDSFVDTTEM